MCFNQRGNLIQDQTIHIYLPKPLLERTSAMGDNLDNFIGKSVVWGNSRVPDVNELFNYDRNKSIKL